jgi:hypothetical protein
MQRISSRPALSLSPRLKQFDVLRLRNFSQIRRRHRCRQVMSRENPLFKRKKGKVFKKRMGRLRRRNQRYKPRTTRAATEIIENKGHEWIENKSDKVNSALLGADRATTNPQLWKEADAALAEFSIICPQIVLAREIATTIRHLSPLLPDLWDITASYATSHDDARRVGAANILWLRIGCLLMSGQFATAHEVESNITLDLSKRRSENSREAEDFHEWALRLFYSQQFGEAKRLFEKVQDGLGDFGRLTCMLNAILCSLFMGQFTDAKILMESASQKHDLFNIYGGFGGWSAIAVAIMQVQAQQPNLHDQAWIIALRSLPPALNVREAARRILGTLAPERQTVFVDRFPRILATKLLDSIDPTRSMPYAFHPEQLREAFSSTVIQMKHESADSFSVQRLTAKGPPTLSMHPDFIRQNKNNCARVIASCE